MKSFVKTKLAVCLMGLAALSFNAAAATQNKTNAPAVSPAEKAKIEEVVHQYLVSHPEVLVEAMQVLQQKQYEQAQQTVKQTQQTASSFAKSLFHQANDPVAGNPDGKVTVVEFFDYQCPHCVDMAPVMSSIIKANPDLRVVFKDFPIRGPVSEFAARAALAANKQGKYDAFSHALLTSGQPLTQDSVLQTAKTIGLNVDKLKKDMEDQSIKDQLKANIKLAQDLKLFGTPALFIGKTNAKGSDTISYVPGSTDQKQLQSMIDQVK
ncbi:Disulfide bond formation protein D [Aquicella siphonis]|uniref:Disulfide bond formation protein D n=1 Tax=Aquicella siphonis TaxID=254247 RepID=A0A5E4PI61_9COXI|nr:DsbA family protein [Aquicella siphonis]VVC76740.1 Disulfide bond formation protein D [Aquicella siphonis]